MEEGSPQTPPKQRGQGASGDVPARGPGFSRDFSPPKRPPRPLFHTSLRGRGARKGGREESSPRLHMRVCVNNVNGFSQWEQSPKLGARPEAFRQKTSMNLSVEAERPWHCRLTMLLAM